MYYLHTDIRTFQNRYRSFYKEKDVKYQFFINL